MVIGTLNASIWIRKHQIHLIQGMKCQVIRQINGNVEFTVPGVLEYPIVLGRDFVTVPRQQPPKEVELYPPRRMKSLSDDEVAKIRWLYANTEKTQNLLASEFGCSVSTISQIVRRESRRNVPDIDFVNTAS